MKTFIKGLIIAFMVLFAPAAVSAVQGDFDVANQLFPAFRADMNNNFQAGATLSSGALEPTVTFPYMLWADTTAGLLKQRNTGDTIWVDIGVLDSSNLGLLPLTGGRLTGRLGFSEGAPIASLATTDISAVAGNIAHVTGVTSISAFTMSTGQIQDIIFDGILTLTFNATTNKTLTGLDILTAVDDVARYYFDGTTVRMIDYIKVDGTALVGSADLSSPGDIGNTTPATSLAVDNMTFDGNLIATVTGDLDLKAVSGSEVTIQDDADPTKEIVFDLNGATTTTKTTVIASQTVARSITLPDATDTLVGRDTTDTLTNKTLTTPVISSISNTGTVTLPTATDTLVGRATTDTLTNKTFDANGTGNALSNVDIADLANGTDGELITWDAAGAPAAVPVGTAAQVLTSNGIGAAPTFQDSGGVAGLYSTVANFAAPNASYSGNETSVASEDTAPLGVTFSTDGTKFFMVGDVSSRVFEYTVSIPYDLGSTVTYTGNSHLMSGEDAQPYSIAFNSAGTKFLMVGNGGNSVYEYTVATGFDLSSTVTYTGNSFSVATEETIPFTIAVNSDGTKFFIAGDGNNTVYEYTVSTGFDLGSTVAYSGNSFDVSTEVFQPYGLSFSTDGEKFFIFGDGRIVFEYTASVGFDLSSTVALTNNFFSAKGEVTTGRGLAFSADGNKFFVIDQTFDDVTEYSTRGPFDLSSNAPQYSGDLYNATAETNSTKGVAFNPAGTKLYLLDSVSATVFEYTVSVAFDLTSTVTYTTNSFSVSTQQSNPQAIVFNTDGTKFFIAGITADLIYEYSVSVGFDLGSTVAYSGNSASTSEEANATGLAFNGDGTSFYIVGTTGDTVYEYSVSVGFDLSSTVAFTTNSFSIASEEVSPQAVAFSPNGLRMFVMGSQSDALFEYSVSTAFDLGSTVAFTNNSFSTIQSVDEAEFTPEGLFINPAGTKAFIIGANDRLYDYTIQKPFLMSGFFDLADTDDGFLVRLDSSGGPYNIFLPDSTGLSVDYRVGIMKETSDVDTVNVQVSGSDTVNGGTGVVLMDTQYELRLFSLDQSTGEWVYSPL